MSRVRRRPTAVAEQLEWDKANNKVLKVLFTSVSDEQLTYVIEEDLAENVWNCLKTLHGQTSDERLWQLLQEQFDIANQKSKSVEEKAQRIQNINAEIMSIDKESVLPKKYRMLLLFNSISKEYDTMIQILQAEKDTKWDQVISKLKARELQMSGTAESKTEDEDTAFSGHQLTCFYCKKPGHFHRNCSEWLETDEEKRYIENRKRGEDAHECKNCGSQRKAGIGKRRGQKLHRANVAHEDSEESSDDYDQESSLMAVEKARRKTEGTGKPWIVDSGASRHMTNQRDLFTEINPIDSVIHTANNGTMIAEGIGTVRVMVKNVKGKAIKTNIHGVLYVPQCSENLLLEGQLNERGIEIMTANGKKSFRRNGKLVTIAI